MKWKKENRQIEVLRHHPDDELDLKWLWTQHTVKSRTGDLNICYGTFMLHVKLFQLQMGEYDDGDDDEDDDVGDDDDFLWYS